MKAILVLEMPKNCLECPFRYKSEEMSLGSFTYQSLFRCKFEPEGLCEDDGDTVYLNDIMMKGKPDWCPLRPAPEKRQTLDNFWEMCANIVRNACIDEILGGLESE